MHRNRDIFDLLGGFYSMISSTQGGWTILSSEGRYMGSAAWGDGDRLTNPLLPPASRAVPLRTDGTVRLNRALANWPRSLQARPYTKALHDILGPPIPLDAMWNPDAVMRVDVASAEVDAQDRFDKAAATQLVFEDALFHIVGHLIRTTGSRRLVLDRRHRAECDRQHAAAGSASRTCTSGCRRCRAMPACRSAPPITSRCQMARRSASQLRHAFHCGVAPDECRDRGGAAHHRGHRLGRLERSDRDRIADLLACCIAQDGVLGLFQGPAETGPRALGHRSILANPCNPRTLETINRLVKFREPFRPLAPMLTLEAAHRWFDLQDGASDDDYNAYNYMVLTVRPRPDAIRHIPAVIHRDNTSRIQIVREDTDPFTHAYLKAMGRRAGVEVSVNTSLNVAGPIVQTPQQALEALRRSKAMDGVLLLGAEGGAYLAWHAGDAPPKDGGLRLRRWLQQWRAEAGVMA